MGKRSNSIIEVCRRAWQSLNVQAIGQTVSFAAYGKGGNGGSGGGNDGGNPSTPGQDNYPPEPRPTPFDRLVRYGLILLLLLVAFLLGIWLCSCLGIGGEGGGTSETVEVTRIVEVTEIVTNTVEIPVEFPVTRIVTNTELVVTEVPVTRIVTNTEVVVTEVPVTRIVTNTEVVVTEIPVTRIVIVTPMVTIPPVTPPPPGTACTRFDLEVGRDRERGTHGDGIYVMREANGREVTRWSAKNGWLDSGWQRNLFISQTAVHVTVDFYPSSGGIVQMEILNPAPNTSVGWLARNVCHAIEIQFPENY